MLAATGPATAEPPVSVFPPMPLAEWVDTKETLHRFLQVVGKLRLANAPRRNHWWHIPFHLTGRGLTTHTMGFDPVFAIDLDLVDHRLEVSVADGRRASFPLPGLSVAAFYRQLLDTLAALGLPATVELPVPFDLADRTPFAEDEHHASYDRERVTRYWVVLGQVAQVLEEFAGRSYAKTSPVHHFWHTFDIAVTRFSDRRVEQPASVDPVPPRAHSPQGIRPGLWFGDEPGPAPALYSYTPPDPPG